MVLLVGFATLDGAAEIAVSITSLVSLATTTLLSRLLR
jgi:hypothetical protein